MKELFLPLIKTVPVGFKQGSGALITVVSSGSYLFAGTVRDCLREGKDTASDEEMQETLEKAALWDFVKSQGGLDFELKERAENLSGGERQRIGLFSMTRPYCSWTSPPAIWTA